MLTKTLRETQLPDAGGAVRLIYRCRMCEKVFSFGASPNPEGDFYNGALEKETFHDCREGECYKGVTGIADLIGWEGAPLEERTAVCHPCEIGDLPESITTATEGALVIIPTPEAA